MVPPKRQLGQEKPIEEFVNPLPLSRKRRTSSKMAPDQSTEQLNDVTSLSGINLREEELMLFSEHEGSQVSISSWGAVQGEGLLILQKVSKYGIKNISKDAELCLTLSLEERMRGLISNLIRMSKQRVDFEKERHQTLLASDVQHKIVVMNQKVEDDWEKLQAEEDEMLKLKNAEGGSKPQGRKNDGYVFKTPKFGGDREVGGNMDRDADCLDTSKANEMRRMTDDIHRTAAANVTLQASGGGNELTSQWQLMPRKSQKNHKTRRGAENKGQGDHGSQNRVQGGQSVMHCLSIKDIIAVLEREPQLSMSRLIYCLHERLNVNAAAI